MKRKLLCCGNSHLATVAELLDTCARKFGIEPVFVPLNWVDLEQLGTVREKLSVGADASIEVNDPSGARSIEIAADRFLGFITAGAPFGGPGELFRAIAAKSFTGSFKGVPDPTVVACCYPFTDSSDRWEGSISHPAAATLPDGLVSSACLRAIFDHWYQQLFDTPLARVFAQFMAVRPLAHIPTPPMPGITVIHRFGRHVFESPLGHLMNECWAEKARVKLNEVSVFTVPESCVEDGWLKAEYVADGHPTLEIHGNKRYGQLFETECGEWIERAMLRT